MRLPIIVTSITNFVHFTNMRIENNDPLVEKLTAIDRIRLPKGKSFLNVLKVFEKNEGC